MTKASRISALSAVFCAATAVAVTPAASYDFNGFYGGVQLGYGFGDTEQAFGVGPGFGAPFVLDATQEADFDGVVGGVHLGHNWASPSGWVWGVEGDLELSGQSGNDAGNGGDINGVDANWQASVRARLGKMVSPTALIYATGGIAFLDADLVKENAPADSDSLSFTGWTAGAGLELDLGSNISGRVEYRYTDFGDDDGRVSFYGVEASPESHTVRVGISFDF
ncbi:MAG: outer membrane beta-barrel protein [Alphaproteobacteria bacterium]|nr:outer membrane beta-barrel protein [Alphaproteobacteria bacterium]